MRNCSIFFKRLYKKIGCMKKIEIFTKMFIIMMRKIYSVFIKLRFFFNFSRQFFCKTFSIKWRPLRYVSDNYISKIIRKYTFESIYIKINVYSIICCNLKNTLSHDLVKMTCYWNNWKFIFFLSSFLKNYILKNTRSKNYFFGWIHA